MATSRSQMWVMALAASQMGFLVAGGLLLGLWLDRLWATSPWLALVGLVAGFAGGVRILISLVKMSREADKSDE